jgi:hypothetical protein
MPARSGRRRRTDSLVVRAIGLAHRNHWPSGLDSTSIRAAMSRPPHRLPWLLGLVLVVATPLGTGCGRRRFHGHGQYGQGTLRSPVEEDPLPPPKPLPEPEPPPPPPPPPPPTVPEPRHPEPTACGPRKPGSLTASVQGVASDDVLNIRAKPDFHSEIRGSIPPDATGVVLIGGPRGTHGSTWREVECQKVHGWVRDKFLTLDEN